MINVRRSTIYQCIPITKQALETRSCQVVCSTYIIFTGRSLWMPPYIFLVQPESCGENSRNVLHILKQLKKIRLSPIRGTYRVFLIKRNENDQRTIILLTLAQIMLFIVLFGFVSIHPLYLYGKPLCFNVLDLAILTSAQFSLMIVISIILSFFQKRLIMNTMIVPFIGILLYIVHLILFGLAHAVWFLYLGKIVTERLVSCNLFILFFVQRFLLVVCFLLLWRCYDRN